MVVQDMRMRHAVVVSWSTRLECVAGIGIALSDSSPGQRNPESPELDSFQFDGWR
jgi:hypothetical protein